MTKAAIVGLGAISFEHIKKLRAIPDVRIVGVCDLESTLTAAVAERFTVTGAFTDYQAMLDDTAPDVVHVLTPPGSHAALARLALEAGAHVVVEKPITPTYAEYEELRDLAIRRDRMLCENYTYRFAPVVLRALELTRNGTLGDVISIDVSYAGVMGREGAYADADVVHFAHTLPGGALQNFVSHPLSVAVAFAPEIESASAWTARLSPGFASDDELRALLTGPRSSATITVSGNVKPGHFLLRVQGSRATAEVDVLLERLVVHREGSSLVAAARRGFSELAVAVSGTARKFVGRADPWFSGLRILLERFYAAAANGSPPPLPLAEMDVVNAIIRDLFDDARAG